MYEAKTFTVPSLEGISDKSVQEHIGLYQGYVKNFNTMTVLMDEYLKDSEKNAHALSELVRRRSFEFGGMKLHELYFPQFEGGASALSPDGAFAQSVTAQFGSTDEMINQIRAVAMMRGPGWSNLYYNPEIKKCHIGFAGEQHMGHFVTLPILLALDVWEHAYLLDHGAAGKAKYVEAFFKNLNWKLVEERFAAAQ